MLFSRKSPLIKALAEIRTAIDIHRASDPSPEKAHFTPDILVKANSPLVSLGITGIEGCLVRPATADELADWDATLQLDGFHILHQTPFEAEDPEAPGSEGGESTPMTDSDAYREDTSEYPFSGDPDLSDPSYDGAGNDENDYEASYR